MSNQSRAVGIELQVANKPQFLAEMEEIAQRANDLFKFNLSGGSAPGAPSMPTPPSQQAPESYIGVSNPNAPMRSAESLAEAHRQAVSRMPNAPTAPTTAPSRGSSGNHSPNTSGGLGQFAYGYQRFHHATHTLLPMYGSLLGAGAISAGYNTASSLAVQAGQIGMNTGGNNPTGVFNRLTTAGKAEALAPTQLAETIRAQGFASGTGNLALLFRDSQQTAIFARALGIGNGQAAQIMGSYQLSGAFKPGQEASTAAQIAAAQNVSGMNASAFAQGVQTLASQGQRTGVQTNGGVATSLAMVNRLGASLNMPLLQNANGVQTLQTLQQGWGAGPGAQSGLYASQMLPLYNAVQKSMAPTYNKMGITSPFLQMSSLTQTSLADYPKQMLEPLLTAMHKELTAPGLTGGAKQMTELGMSQFLFGNISAASLQNVSKLAQIGPLNLSATEKAIQDAQGTLKKNDQTYLGSISGDVSKIQQTTQAILDKLGGGAIHAGAAVAPIAGAHPGLTAGLVGAGSVASGLGLLNTARRVLGPGAGGGGIGGGMAGGASRGSGMLSKILPLAEDGTIDAAKSLPIVGSLAAVGLNKLNGDSWGKSTAKGAGALIGGTLGMAIPIPGLDVAASIGLSAAGSWAGGELYNLFHRGSHPLAPSHASANTSFAQAAEQSRATAVYPIHVTVSDNKSSPQNSSLGPFSTSSWVGSAQQLAGVGSVGQGIGNWTIRDANGNPTSATPQFRDLTGGLKYQSLINQNASRFNVPANLIAGIMAQESGGNPYSINDNTRKTSKTYSSLKAYLAAAQQLIAKGDSIDMGLMQINSIAHPNVTPAQAADPNYAIAFASQLLSSDYKGMDNSWTGAIRAYNAGLQGAKQGGGYGYLQAVENKMSAFKTQPKTRPSQKHNLNRKAQSGGRAVMVQ